MNYFDKLNARIEATGSALCVGLDPRPEQGSGSVDATKEFLSEVIEQSSPFAACYKPNAAYFEALGSKGIALMEETFAMIPSDIPIVLDGKRGDIGETQKYYAKASFDTWQVDAITVNPYLGRDSLEPFLEYQDKGVYVLGVTSNPGSADIQMKQVSDDPTRYVFEEVVDLIAESKNAGLVLGLTSASPEVLEKLPDVPLLIPGLGAQGGELSRLAGTGRKAASVINVSRGILYPDTEISDSIYAERSNYYADEIAKHL